MIHVTDIIIVYLSFGAPFGVFYLFKGRTEYQPVQNWLRGLFAFFFWMPFAFKMLQNEIRSSEPSERVFGKTPSMDSDFDKNLLFVQKQFEKILRESNAGFSLYHFRELFERYSGLTVAVNAASDDSVCAGGDYDIFSISGKDVSALSSLCLRRRNRLCLTAHQENAKREFSFFLSILSDSNCDLKKLGDACGELAIILNDAGTLSATEEPARRNPQTVGASLVSLLENELWKRGQHELLATNRPTPQMRAMTATNSPAND